MPQPLYGMDRDGDPVPLRVDRRGRLVTGALWLELLRLACAVVTALSALSVLGILLWLLISGGIG